MTFKELHEILDNPNNKITSEELAEIIFQLKKDASKEAMKLYDYTDVRSQKLQQWYYGEVNAFYIVLDLLEHLKE